jgi:alpha-N-arabinofuranosidase
VDATRTVIWAQFKDIDPNGQQVEVNARQSVFYPDKSGRNYITVRGFTLRNAATPWAPPTVEQIGLIGVHWSKGWIIEDNNIAYSTCSGITLGKYGEDKDKNSGSASGYVTTIERGLQNGWNKETIGHHVVRNNHISHCEQVGIVGSLGAAFSTITGNTIHDIHVRQLFSGAEMAGIKFHGAIDTTISGNHIYRTCRGIWLDWMTQGARISNNLCHDNATHDLFVEVNHGPFVVDNNIFLSPKAIEDDSQGGAYTHNLIGGGIDLNPTFFDGRKTPFHKAHSTEVVALHDNPSGDNHYYNNLFMRNGSLEKYDHAHLPMWMDGNVFFQGAKSSKHESAPINRSASDPGLTLVEKNDGFYLTMTLATALGSERPSLPVTSARLGKPTISGCAFENPDGSPITIGTDYFGKPRNAANPTPGPFEAPGTGPVTMKVWPLASTSDRAGVPNFWDEIPLSPSTRRPSVVLDDYWNSEFQRVNREVAAAQNTRLVFFGDSITWCWSLGDLTGQAVWNENYSKYNPINMGNSGDITPVMLHRVTRGNLDFADGQHPKVAVLLCGINNLGVSQSAGGREQWHLGAHCPPADIANGIRAIAQVFRRRLPGTRLIMMATLPVSDEGKRATCRQASAINAALVRNDNEVAYVDLQDKFMLPDGSLNKQLFTDGTHLTPEGYRVWAKGIEPLVLKFMEAPPLKPVKIMLIGDSMTEGADSNSSYRRYLDGMLRRDGQLIDFVGSRRKHNDDKTEPDNYDYDVDHEGHWGKGSAWMAENMQSLLASNVPDVAVINLGTEDIMSSNVAAESLTDGIVKNIGKVVDTLRARNGKMKIVLSTVIPVAGKQDVVNLVNLKISRYVQSNSTHPCPVVLADPCKGFDASRDLAADGAHPNASGARKMARVCADVIHNTDLEGQPE